jgi:hypothetical protein
MNGKKTKKEPSRFNLRWKDDFSFIWTPRSG